MVFRLEDVRQVEVTGSWENMLSPVDRLDRILLLDTVLAGQLHQMGVDRLLFVSRKYVRDGAVTMEVFFERDKPEFDLFTITYVDGTGRELRHEQYTREEVDGRWEFLFHDFSKGDCEDTPEAQREKMAALKAQREVRMEEIKAATQPAGEP
jgi:hypothetical protein